MPCVVSGSGGLQLPHARPLRIHGAAGCGCCYQRSARTSFDMFDRDAVRVSSGLASRSAGRRRSHAGLAAARAVASNPTDRREDGEDREQVAFGARPFAPVGPVDQTRACHVGATPPRRAACQKVLPRHGGSSSRKHRGPCCRFPAAPVCTTLAARGWSVSRDASASGRNAYQPVIIS